MSIFGDTFSDIKKRLSDFLNTAEGDVTSLPLDLLNRAQDKLWQEADWDYLVTDLTLSITSKAVTNFPSDFGRIESVFSDEDSDGKPDTYYYKDCKNASLGYKLQNAFTKAAGHSFTMTFFASPSNDVTLRYIKNLTNFANTGTEYSYFPGNLLLLAAQRIHISEAGLDNAEAKRIVAEYENELSRYKAAHQFVNTEMDQEIIDADGSLVELSDQNLDGS